MLLLPLQTAAAVVAMKDSRRHSIRRIDAVVVLTLSNCAAVVVVVAGRRVNCVGSGCLLGDYLHCIGGGDGRRRHHHRLPIAVAAAAAVPASVEVETRLVGHFY